MEAIQKIYDRSLARGTLSANQVRERMGLITPACSYESLRTAGLIIEAVYEHMDVKQQVLQQLDRVAGAHNMLASNTSGLDINALADFTGRPDRFVGMHFFSPAHVMKLLEVVKGHQTSPSCLSAVLDLAKRIDKIPVIAGVSDGFIGNRMLARYVAAADNLIRQGALPDQVDKALEKFGFAMGPFRMGDLAGLDIAQAGRRRRAAANPDHDYTMIADALCEAGRFGQKTGAGWYRYGVDGRKAMPDPEVATLIEDWRASRGIRPRIVTDAEIVERCVFALVNEGARLLDEGIAQRASDIDVVYVYGYGFPRDRGGPMHYAHQLGLGHVVHRITRFSEEPGSDPSWTPAPLLTRLESSHASFDDC